MAKEPLKSFFELFGQNSDNLDRFLVKFHSKLNIFIYHTISIFKLWQQQFSPKVTKLRPYHLNERTERYVREFRDVRGFRGVPELRVPPNLIWRMFNFRKLKFKSFHIDGVPNFRIISQLFNVKVGEGDKYNFFYPASENT